VKRSPNKRYEVFARNYVIDLNASRAAIAAGYSEGRAAATGSELVSNRKVQRIIQELQTQRASKLELRAEKVLEEIARLAFSNMQDYTRVDADGKAVLDLSVITRDQFAAVQEIREDTTGGTGDGERKVVLRTTLKLSDKTKNLELLCRHLGLLQDNLKVTGLEGLADRLNDIRTRKHGTQST
jgi:phage terminase small subunit